ncbi:hypothetical protein PHAMO_400066 [Magnetospirillum molischianum DSM 120]|uniref:Uncharacterized protein n=1 Tax=Magnetospirillum molischianum DSM 120 TaxID=1150626 RepID=H8FWE7_MAGML|nr:hypothetical protein PHAMO_400066 [Magnetospirillum molischianum DSM 120]
MSLPGIGRFRIAEGNRVEVEPANGADPGTLGLLLSGPVLAVLLRPGVACLTRSLWSRPAYGENLAGAIGAFSQLRVWPDQAPRLRPSRLDCR